MGGVWEVNIRAEALGTSPKLLNQLPILKGSLVGQGPMIIVGTNQHD